MPGRRSSVRVKCWVIAPSRKSRMVPAPGAPSPDQPTASRLGPRCAGSASIETLMPMLCGTPRNTGSFGGTRPGSPESVRARISSGSSSSASVGIDSATNSGSTGCVVQSRMNSASIVKLWVAGWQVPQVRPLPLKVSSKNIRRPSSISARFAGCCAPTSPLVRAAQVTAVTQPPALGSSLDAAPWATASYHQPACDDVRLSDRARDELPAGCVAHERLPVIAAHEIHLPPMTGAADVNARHGRTAAAALLSLRAASCRQDQAGLRRLRGTGPVSGVLKMPRNEGTHEAPVRRARKHRSVSPIKGTAWRSTLRSGLYPLESTFKR